MAGYYLAEVVATIPAHDPRRMEALGMKECSRGTMPRSLPAGTLVRIRGLAGTPFWMAYARSGEVVKLRPAAARAHLRAIRDADGRAVVDIEGVGAELCREQNARGGNVERWGGARPGVAGPTPAGESAR